MLLTERLEYAFTDPGMVGLLRGLAAELGAAGQSMLLVPSEADDVGDVVRSALVDAFIVCSMDVHDEAVAAVRQRRLPLVTVGHPKLPGVPIIGIDNARAAALAADHLLGLGHRRFGVVGLPGRDPGDTEHRDIPVRTGLRDRVEGFRRAISARARTSLTLVDATVHTHEEGLRVARELLDVPTSRRPTAVFAVTDVLAFGVLEVARDLGISVPRRPLGRRLRRHRGGAPGDSRAHDGLAGPAGEGADRRAYRARSRRGRHAEDATAVRRARGPRVHRAGPVSRTVPLTAPLGPSPRPLRRRCGRATRTRQAPWPTLLETWPAAGRWGR